MVIEVKSVQKTLEFGQQLGELLRGGLVIELIGDVGAGKTTLVKGIAKGLEIDEPIQSPTFTISRVYDGRDTIQLAHYDFYRLSEAGIMNEEIAEMLDDTQTVTIVEWAGAVQGVLPEDRITITITPTSEEARHFDIRAGGEKSSQLVELLR